MSIQIAIPDIPVSYRGKVRDIYDLGDKLVIVASDRVSAFDVVFDQIIPGKGEILTSISNHWFSLIKHIPNHLIETDSSRFPEPFQKYADVLKNRSVMVKKAKRIDIECIARGYLLGSAFKEYQKTQTVNQVKMPPGLFLGSKLPEAIFTPSTKADTGHDENISYEQIVDKLGKNLAENLKNITLQTYHWACDKLAEHDIILADTKFEFGFIDEEIHLIDEVLTPDSSRFFQRDIFEKNIKEGVVSQGMDKQIIRDYLESIQWNKMPPPPELPKDIIVKTIDQYKKIREVIHCIS